MCLLFTPTKGIKNYTVAKDPKSSNKLIYFSCNPHLFVHFDLIIKISKLKLFY